MLPNQKPTLHVIFTNEFGDKTEIIKELSDSTCDSVVSAFRESLLGIGFHPDNVNEYFGEE